LNDSGSFPAIVLSLFGLNDQAATLFCCARL